MKTVVCVRSCSIPAMGIVAQAGEERVVDESTAERLVSTGRFAYNAKVEPEPVRAPAREEAGIMPELIALGISEMHVRALAGIGIETIDALAEADVDAITAIRGVGEATARKWIAAAGGDK